MTEGTYKTRLQTAFGKPWCDRVLTGDYRPAVPFSIQDVDITATLPAIFYLSRYVQRRGKGRLAEVFGGGDKEPSVASVASQLARTHHLRGFEDETARHILGDLLMGFCLENRSRSEDKQEPLRRALPTHYFAGWLDLPGLSVHLRYVPETIVAMLAGQHGPTVTDAPVGDPTPFPVGRRFRENLLLRPFLRGVTPPGPFGDLSSDRFDEVTPVILPELLTIRLAEALGQPPRPLSASAGGAAIPNQQPLACIAAPLREDLEVFMAAYGETMPRGVLINLLDAALAVGLSTILTGTAVALTTWVQDGRLPSQLPRLPVLMDASNGLDRELKRASKKVFEAQSRLLAEVPVILMALRLLDAEVSAMATLSASLPARMPHGDAYLNVLGDVLYGRHPASASVLEGLAEKASRIAGLWAEDDPQIVRDLQAVQPPSHELVWRLARVLTTLRGRKQSAKWFELLDACFLCNHPCGLVMKPAAASRRGRREMRHPTLTDTMLDYLVHLWVAHQLREKQPPTVEGFFRWLRNRYGLYVHETFPSQAPVPATLLRKNRQWTEDRLRDLGLFVSVSDAESGKRLLARFPTSHG
ncbi:hypothetical protein J8C02_13355 [Chloracidobacterium sp. MS 40/45]|uniref:hypothetical protein n=1 Tax=Chloracidobacterium aggregatum TaxID=2851959 RepID=UPI001B8C9154|nr:hypothetical protein [Chloracidobacterium aggregatum]QUW01132.1 hypothetical protein J8C02_13355 [Chloracidobacterium sp. MS 40/45]